MLPQIKIPAFAMFSVNEHHSDTTHLVFPYEKEKEFHAWCAENNIGNGPEFIQGIVKSDCHVFWKGTCPVEFIREQHS